MVSFLSTLTPPRADRPARAPSTLVSRNVTVGGHRTSVRLEPAMWDALLEICRREQANLSDVVTYLGRGRSESSLTSAIRIYALAYFKAAATEDGHGRAGHGTARLREAPRPESPLPATAEQSYSPI